MWYLMKKTEKKRQIKDINIQIGDRCRKAREAAGYTQELLAEVIDKTPQFISDAERGISGMSLPTIMKLCSTLSVSADYLLFGRNEDNSLDLSERICNLTEPEKKIIKRQINLTIQAFHTHNN